MCALAVYTVDAPFAIHPQAYAELREWAKAKDILGRALQQQLTPSEDKVRHGSHPLRHESVWRLLLTARRCWGQTSMHPVPCTARGSLRRPSRSWSDASCAARKRLMTRKSSTLPTRSTAPS